MNIREEIDILHAKLADLHKVVEDLAAKVEQPAKKAMPKKVTKAD